VNHYRSSRILLFVLLIFWEPVGELSGESNLVTHSPFLPPDWGQQAAEKPAQPVTQKGPLSRELEFRGVFSMNGVTKFGVFDRNAQKGQWFPLNSGNDRFTVIRYNEGMQTILIKADGRIEELSLKEADDKPLPVMGALNTLRPPSPPPPVNGASNANAEGDDDDASRTSNVPRRRIIRPRARGEGNSGNAANNGAANNREANNNYPNLPANIPPPPNFTPGPPPDFTPPPPPNMTQ